MLGIYQQTNMIHHDIFDNKNEHDHARDYMTYYIHDYIKRITFHRFLILWRELYCFFQKQKEF